MPVSKTCASVSISSNLGGSRWIGRLVFDFTSPLPSIGMAQHVEDATERRLPDRDGDRRAGVL